MLTSLSVSVNGDINNMFGGISNTMQKVRSDVKSALRLKNEERIIFKESEEDVRDFSAVRPEANQVNAGRKEGEVETRTQPAATTTVNTKVNPTTVSPTAKSNTTTIKDGRENFAGACTTGYQRTADGRCMPTF